MISAPELRAVNVFVKDQGHLSILLAPAVTGVDRRAAAGGRGRGRAGARRPVEPIEPAAGRSRAQRPPRASASA